MNFLDLIFFPGFSLGLGLMVTLLGCYWLYRIVKRKKEAKRKSDHFKRNGGLLLQQQIGSIEGNARKTKIFPVKLDELQIAKHLI